MAGRVTIDTRAEQPRIVGRIAARLGRLSADRRSLGGSLATAGLLQLVLVASGVIVARSLGAEDRGYLALLVVISGICTLLGSLGIFSAVTYYLARDRDASRRIVGSLRPTAMVQVAATVALQAVVLIAVAANDPQRVQVAAVISLLLTPGLFAYGYGEAILLGQQRFTAFNIFRAVPTTAYALFVLVAWIAGAADIVVIMSIWAGANFFGGILTLVVAVRGLGRTASRGPIPSPRTMIGFGLKSLLGSLSPIETFRADQAIVGLFLNPVALGLYVVAQAFTNLPRVVAQSIGYIAYPRVAAYADRADGRRALWKFFFVGVAVTGAVSAVLLVAAETLIRVFFGSEFMAAVPVAQILLVGTFFSSVRRVLTDGLRGLGHPGVGTIAEVSSWIVLVPAVAVLLSHGAKGVALGLTVAWAFSLGVALVFAVMEPTSLFRVPLRAPQILGVTVTAVAAVTAGVAVAVLPGNDALFLVGAIAAALFFAFGRSALAGRGRTLQQRLAQARSPGRDVRAVAPPGRDDELRTARRLYYLGLIFMGLLTLRAGGQVTYSDALFLFSFVFAAAELMIVRRRVPMRLPLLLLFGMVIFSIGGLVSTYHSYAAFKSVAVIARVIFLTVFWFWLGTIVLTRREHVQRAITLWIASAAICAAGGIAQVLTGIVLPGGSALQFGRATGFTTQPNELGGLTCIAFVPALMLAARPGLTARARLQAYVLLCVVGGGLILSGSIGALLAAVVGTFFWVAFQKTSVQSLAVFATIGVCVIGVITVQAIRGAPTPLQRFDRVTNNSSSSGSGSGSLDSRILIYRAAAKAIRKDPFIGVGLDIVSVTKPFGVVDYQFDVHNLIIGTWYKAGLLGLAGMLIALFAVFRTGWTAILRSASGADQRVGVALLSALTSFVAFAMSEPVLFSRYGWIPAALIIAQRAVQQREAEAFVREPLTEPRLEPRLVSAARA